MVKMKKEMRKNEAGHLNDLRRPWVTFGPKGVTKKAPLLLQGGFSVN